MLLRYAHRPLSVLGVGYILASRASVYTSPFELHLSFPSIRPVREISRKTVSSAFISLAALGFTCLFYGPPVRVFGLVLALIAGGISLGAGLGQLFGYWEWIEFREMREAEEDIVRMERVLGALEAAPLARRMIEEVVYGWKGVVSIETKYGTLVTSRTERGYRVVLEGEKQREVELVYDAGLEVDGEWADTAESLVRAQDDKRWEALLDLYR